MDHYKTRKDCRLCKSKNLKLVIKLTPTPPANAFVKENKLSEVQDCFPLDLFQCLDCKHVQLLTVIDPKILFKDYVYVSGTSPVFIRHFEKLAEKVISKYNLKKRSLIVEIGSNDGTLLKFFKRSGMNVLGIDPATEIAKTATDKGIETLPLFFDKKLAKSIRKGKGAAKVIPANNVFAHVDDMEGFVEGVRELLDEDGIFIFEVSYLVDVFEKTLFDMTYHEHLAYHSVVPLISFFKKHGLELIETFRVNTHGGSLRGIVQLEGGPWEVGESVLKLKQLEAHLGLENPDMLIQFGKRIDTLGRQLKKLIQGFKDNGKTIIGFGAPAKATTLMYHFGINNDLLDFIIDDSPLKQGLYSPGLHIPVLPSQALYDAKPDYALILAWNFAGSIIDNHSNFSKLGGKFIVPLPKIIIK